MKRLFYLLLGIVLVCSLRVNALNDDYLTYITTQDTVAVAGSMGASPKNIQLKKGTTFKMAYHAGGINTIVLSNGEYADSIKKGTYKLKGSFDKKSAHKLDNNSYETNQKVVVYSDPSGLNKIGALDIGTKVNATHYYGPYYYLTNNKITGWVYVDYLTKYQKEDEEDYEATVLPSSDDPNIIIDDEDESGVSLEELPDQPKETVNVKWITVAIILSMLIIGLIVALIVVIKKDKSE